MKVTVSGKTYDAALDPRATGYPEEAGLPEPEWQKRGRGHRATYDLTPEQVEDMIEHLETLAGSFTFGATSDHDVAAEGRACAKDAARMRDLLTV